MGTVHAEIILNNLFDEEKAREGLIKEGDVRSITVQAVVDTGAASLVINEEQFQHLGLSIMEERKARVADGRWVHCKIAKGVIVHWKDRWMICPAMVIPGAAAVLLGAIPLEGMDLMVNPGKQELVGVHGDEVQYMVYEAASA